MVTMLGWFKALAALGLLHEALLAAGIGDFVGRQNLDCHAAIQMGVVSLVDDTHAAFAELFDNSIMRQRAADHGSTSPRWLL